MTKLEKLIEELCPTGVQRVVLNSICNIYDGTHKTPKYTDSGIKFVSVENINSLYETKKYISVEDYNRYKIKPQINDVLMTRIGSIGVCAVVDKDEPLAYYVSLALLRPDLSKLNSKYLKYIIESKFGRKELRKRTLVNAVPIKINMGDIGKIKIPVPPLEVQSEIARILDNFTELTTELNEKLNAELTARNKQYEYYRDELLSFGEDTKIVKLEDVAEISTGSHNTNEGLTEGEYPFFVRSQEVRYLNSYDFDETAIITSGDGVGVGKIFHFVEGKYALHQRAYRIAITSKCLLPRFFFHYMRSSFYNYITKNAVNSSVTSIRRPMMNNYLVPLPTLVEQQRILDTLDGFDIICNDISQGLLAEIEARQKQYEYYRDKLLTFKELKDVKEE